MKKYYMTVTSKDGDIIFKSTSDSAKALIKRYEKAAFFSDGSMSSIFYNSKQDTNITEDVMMRISNGENI